MRIYLPLKTVNPLNRREHWAARARRTKQERHTATLMMPTGVRLPCTITMTRVAPRELDDDAIPAACKGIRDGIADKLGLPNDRDPRVKWLYSQRRGKPKEYAVEVTVSCL